MIVTGPPTTGKTTALLRVGRACHLAEAARRGRGVEGWVPVAYVLVPPGAGAKAPAGEFARFLGIPVTARMTQTRIVDAVCHTYREAGVRLVAIDEIHRLDPRTTTGAEAVDLSKRPHRTHRRDVRVRGHRRHGDRFVQWCTRGAQLAGRATVVDCGPVPSPAGAGGRRSVTWSRRWKPVWPRGHTGRGHCPARRRIPRARTGGRVGSLARLLRQAAIAAILDGTEKITKGGLDAIVLDHTAEDHYRPRVTRRTPAGDRTRRHGT
ncbi:AAA family ATPase [Embleya sp. NPDC020886]|uniref:AAA family ATPase n=1 Tax=Embleya sp. NPDC020886 TaxID=3363980 RepID=UPI0037BC3FAA